LIATNPATPPRYASASITAPGDVPSAHPIEVNAGLTLPVGDQLKLSGNLTGIVPVEGDGSDLARACATHAF
jgi:hypothetical protein